VIDPAASLPLSLLEPASTWNKATNAQHRLARISGFVTRRPWMLAGHPHME